MPDYTVRIEATTEETEKKLKRVDDKVARLEKGASINITVPSAGQVLGTLGDISKTLGTVAKNALAVSKAANIGPGAVLNDLEEVFGILKTSGQKSIGILEALSKATPTNILGNSFNAAADGAVELSKRISNVGYEIFGLTQSVNILKQAFGGFFDDTIGREIRLQESLLRTRTTLVSTSKVLRNGQELTDPYTALIALEQPIEQVLENIRRRSLDIAGTTSDAIVQVFGVVASQVGAFGGSLQDAEDLAITFAGALGTIGMSDPMLANQEIRSILTGNIDQNSVLARSLGITNEEIQRAKRSSEGLVSYLTKRLEGFTAGQKIAAQGFAGIVSNIAEVREEAARTFGKPLLQPLLEGLTAVYKRLQLVFDQILGIADGLGRIGSTVFSGLLGSLTAAPVLQNFDERKQLEAFKATESAIGNAAVQVQTAIDKVRPLIANLASEVIKAFATIGSGLISLAQGFASFKFEQLSLQINSMLGLARILNATLVPTLRVVLDLYGKILALPLFQALTQIGAQLQLLERVGVLPMVRLIYYFGGFWESIKTAIGWVQAFGQAVVRGVQFAVNAVATGISGITRAVSVIGSQVADITQTSIQIVLTAARSVAITIGRALQQLSIQIRLLYPQFSGLADIISNVGRAFRNIDVAVARSQQAVQQFGVQARAALQNVAVAGERVAAATRNIGTTISAFLLPKLADLGGKLKELVVGFIKFQLWLFLIQKAIGFATYAWTQYNKAQQEASDQTKAEMAIKRLSTVYAELGENASGAAKALKAADEAAVKNRIDQLTESYTKLNEKLKEIKALQNPKSLSDYARVLAATLNPANFDIKAKLLDNGNQEPFQVALIRQRREEYQKLQKELNSLTEAEAKLNEGRKDLDNVQILARERKDIEEATKELRKQAEKELREERFRTAREVAQLEQSLRETARRGERAELERRLAQESQGLVGVRAGIAKILGDYERGLFDAQTEAQRRQFEIAEQRQNLEKSLADYKIKTEEQTAKLRKRIGEYNVKIDDYLTTQQKRRDAERLENELKIAALRTEGFILTPKEKEVFQNTAARADIGISSTGLLALLRLRPELLEQYGTPAGRMGSTETLAPWMKQLAAAYPALKDSATIKGSLEKYAQTVNSPGLGNAAYDVAAKDLESNRYFVPKPAAPAKIEPFQDLNRELAASAAERRRLGERIQALRERVNSTLNQQDLFINRNQVLDSLANQTYTDVPTPQTARDQLRAANEQYALLAAAQQIGKREVDPLIQALTELRVTAGNAADQFIESARAMRTPTGGLMYDGKILTDIGTDLKARIENIANLDLDKLRQKIQEFETLLTEERTQPAGRISSIPVILSVLKEALRIREAMPALKATNAQRFVNERQQEMLAFPDQVRAEKQRLSDEYTAAITPSDPLSARLFTAEIQIREERLRLDKANALQTEAGQQYLAQFSEQVRASATELGTFEVKIKSALERVAFIKDIADTYVSGFKNIVNTALSGGNLTEAVNGLMEGLRDKITNYVIDIATKPMRDAIEQNLMKLLKVPTAEELAGKQRDTARDEAMATSLDLDTKRNELLQNIATNLQPPATATGPTPDVSGGNAIPLAVIPSPEQIADQAQSGLAEADAQAKTAAENLRKLNESAKPVPEGFTLLQKTLSGAVGAIGSIAMGIAGVDQMKKGGTYNTLMGLASIFGSIGSLTGMFGTGGLFAPKARATGGPVIARQPYLVGERGPELFMPASNGTVITNSRTRSLLDPEAAGPYGATTAALENRTFTNLNRLSSDPIKLETRVINGVEYATVDQLEQAARQAEMRGAQRGQAMAFGSMRNSIKTRKQLGI